LQINFTLSSIYRHNLFLEKISNTNISDILFREMTFRRFLSVC